jgi:hypothetical protein
VYIGPYIDQFGSIYLRHHTSYQHRHFSLTRSSSSMNVTKLFSKQTRLTTAMPTKEALWVQILPFLHGSNAWIVRDFEDHNCLPIPSRHNVVLVYMAHLRAYVQHVHGPLAPEYHKQRTSVPGTLSIVKGTIICTHAGGYRNVTGIWSDEPPHLPVRDAPRFLRTNPCLPPPGDNTGLHSRRFTVDSRVLESTELTYPASGRF